MTANDLQTLLNANVHVHDPLDFPPFEVAPGLRQLDEALRCDICQEFYLAPMTLNCGHCFCSLCLRDALAEKPQCPKCRQTASDIHMRKNTAVESAVKAWSEARELVLRLVKEEERQKTRNAPVPGASSGSAPNSPTERPRKRLKQSSEHSSDDEVQIVSRPSRHFSKAVTVKEDTNDDRTRPGTDSITSKSPNPLILPKSPPSTPVECPMCQKRVPFDVINQHIDSKCRVFSAAIASSSSAGPSSSGHTRQHSGHKVNQKQEWSKILGGGGSGGVPSSRRSKEKERAKSELFEEGYLPKVSYHPLKDKRILELLQEHELPTTGDRAAWIKRHQKWVVLYNANVDRAIPDRRSREQLRRDLRQWEETLRAGCSTGSGSGLGAGAGKKNVVTDAKAHQAVHKAQFARLVEDARRTRAGATTGTETGTGAVRESSPNAKWEAAEEEAGACSGSDGPVVVSDSDES